MDRDVVNDLLRSFPLGPFATDASDEAGVASGRGRSLLGLHVLFRNSCDVRPAVTRLACARRFTTDAGNDNSQSAFDGADSSKYLPAPIRHTKATRPPPARGARRDFDGSEANTEVTARFVPCLTRLWSGTALDLSSARDSRMGSERSNPSPATILSASVRRSQERLRTGSPDALTRRPRETGPQLSRD